MAENYPRQYEILLKKAKADIAISFHALDADDSDIDNSTILFHFQQAVEKLLKALLSFNQVHFEKIHDISLLVEQCKKNRISVPNDIGLFTELNLYAVIGRYDIVEETGNDPLRYKEQLSNLEKFVETAFAQGK